MEGVLTGSVDISSLSSEDRAEVANLFRNAGDIGSSLYTICLDLHKRASLSRDLEGYNRAINFSLFCLPFIREDEEDYIYAAFCRDLGLSFAARAEILFSIQDSQRSIDYSYASYQRLPTSHENYPVFAASLATSYRADFSVSGDRSSITAARIYIREAASISEEHDTPDASIYHEHSLISQAMVEMGVTLAKQTLIGEAVDASAEAVRMKSLEQQDSVDADSYDSDSLMRVREDLALYRIGYCNALELRYQLFSEPCDITLAIDTADTMLEACPENSLTRQLVKVALAGMHLSRFEQEDDLNSLNLALRHSERAWEAPGMTKVQRLQLICTRCLALQCSFERTGDFRHLNDAIELLEQVDWAEGKQSPISAEARNLLAIALCLRHQYRHSPSDLDSGIEILDGLLDHDSPLYGDPGRMSNEATMRMLRYQTFGSSCDLKKADSLSRSLVNLPSDQVQVHYCAIRSRVLCETAKTRSKRARAAQDRRDAIKFAFRAVQGMQKLPMNPDRAIYLAHLGATTRELWEYTRSETAALAESAKSYQEAAEVVTRANPDFFEYRFHAADADINLSPSGDTEATLDALDEVCESNLAATQIRIKAGRALAQLVSRKDLSRASQIMSSSVALLADLAPPQLEMADRLFALADFGRMTSEAAVTMAAAEQPTRHIIQMLEQGRFIILGQFLDSRRDLSDLERIDKAISQELRQVQQDLNKQASEAVVFQTSRGSRSYQTRTKKHNTAMRLHTLKELIRSKPGFSNFLKPVVDDGLMELSQNGALVYVTVADVQAYGLPPEQGGFAFLLHRGQFQTVRLPGLRLPELRVKAQSLTQALRGVREDKAAASRRLTELLNWLYQSLSLPVLRALGGSKNQEHKQRIWWITGGLLSGLPLHAAGRYDPTGALLEGVPNVALSSYISTGRALLYSQQAMEEYDGFLKQPGTKSKGLLVSMSQTPGEAQLPSAQAEVEHVRDVLALEDAPLDMPDSELVLERLAHVSIAHFACHGKIDLRDPSKSGLLLADCASGTKLDVRRLAKVQRQSTAPAALAFLSACQTMDGSQVEALGEECVHIASAFQIAGFAHTIGTLWSVWDTCSVAVATKFYEELMRKSEENVEMDLRGERIARALDEAVEALRKTGADVVQWVPYAHYGI